MPTPVTPEEFEQSFKTDILLLRQFVNGTKEETVVTESGSFPTLARLASISNVLFLQMAASDLSTPLAAASRVAYSRVINAGEFNEIRASLSTASATGPVQIDIKVNGVSVLSTLLTIDESEKTSKTSSVQHVITNGVVADDDEISIDIIAGGVNAKGLIITLLTY